MQFFTVKLE